MILPAYFVVVVVVLVLFLIIRNIYFQNFKNYNCQNIILFFQNNERERAKEKEKTIKKIKFF